MHRAGSKGGNFPRKYGKYELLERIGDGGMAEVFRARMPGAAGFEKTVVIKRILPHLTYRQQVVDMFIAEAKLTSEVQHKNIVQVYELAESEDGDFFMVMEFINGTDLRRLLKSAAKRTFRVPPWFSVHVMIEVLEALSYVHELTDDLGQPRNIIHRDVSPSNVFISQLGEVKLGDFGIAKDPLQGSYTQAGQLKGKVPYMAPEQLYGDAIDQRADVFAAGVVLWECLAQRRLFGGRPDVAAMRLITAPQRRPPSACIPDVPKALDQAVLEALEVDREKRTQTARDLQYALIELLPALQRVVRPPDVRRVVETLLGKRPKEEGVSLLAIDTDHDFAGDDTEADPPAPKTTSASEPGPRTEMDLSFDQSRVLKSHATEATRAGVPDEGVLSVLSVSTSNPRFTDELANDLVITEAKAPAVEDTPEWLVTGPGMHERVHPELLSSRAGGFGAQRWAIQGIEHERYDGPHPFWVRANDGEQLGPMSFERATALIKAEAKNRLGPEAHISADGHAWLDLAAYTALTGQEGVLFDDTQKLVEIPGSTLGYLDERSVMSVLAWIGHERLTGKLTLSPEGLRRTIHREVHIWRGAPVHVFANEDALQLPEVLISKRVIQKKMAGELVHDALAHRRTLDDTVAEKLHGAKYRVMLMKERMTDMLRWSLGRFLFDPGAQIQTGTPFARSLQALIPELIHRAFTTEELRSVLTPVLDRKMEPARELEQGMDELGFTSAQKEAARLIAKGKKLGSLIRARPQEEKIQLLVAYVLLETQLLIQT